MKVRSKREIERFFIGLELVEPGLQVVPAWRPEPAGQPAPSDAQVSVYGAAARKP
jgi:S-adenosyl methyltransferase